MSTFRAGDEIIISDPSNRTDKDTTTWSFHPTTGLELCKTYADNTSVTKTYDAYNRLATETDARGNVKTHTYEHARGLLQGTSYSDNTAARGYAYNHLGQLTQVMDEAGTRTIGYNAYGEQETDSLLAGEVTHLITETRDSMGRSTGFSYAKNGEVQHTVSTGYSADGRIATAGFMHDGAEKQFGYGYLPGSNLLQTLTMPCNMTLTHSYETERDLLIGMSYHRSTTLVTQRTYTYDTIGRPLTRNTARNGMTMNDSFGYNSRSELASATVNDHNYSYDYDNIGNRNYATVGEEETTYSTNNLNQYTSAGDFTPEFDMDGNQTRIKTETGIWEVIYNAEKRPVRFTSTNGYTIIECSYDSMGRRATKKVTTNGSVTLHQRYIYRGYLQVTCCDLTRSAHPSLWFITWDPTQPTATRPLAIRKDGNWFAYGWDLTKNACEVYGPSGYIRTSYTYTPFGHVASNGDVKQPLQWSSEFYDESIDLVYYTFRYYNSNSANWISRDPVIAKRKETGYLFTRNNPISQYDYLGLLFGFITDFFSQNQPTPPQNTRPQKVQPNTKKERCTNAGLAEAGNKDKASCEKHVDNAMTSKKILDMIAVLTENNCEIPPVVCKCCIGACAGAGGWHFPDKIVMCTNGNQSKKTTTDYVGHELTHRLQKCQNRSGKVCLDFLKNEVEAYKTHVSGCDNIIASALNSIRIGQLCKEEELTQEVIAKARAYCKELK